MDHRAGFSQRLKERLQTIGYECTNYVALTRHFNERHPGIPITHQAFRKWILGINLPQRDSILILCSWLGVTPDWLVYGEGPRPAESPVLSESNKELLKIFNNLSGKDKQTVLELAKILDKL
jgi:hypothetical protein